MKKKIYLFNVIPLLTIKKDSSQKKFLLFNALPIITIKQKEIKGNTYVANAYDNEWTQYNYATCAKVGKKLYCGGKTVLSKNTYLGDYVCFNGCEIHGAGKVTIGNNFHSGVELLIITQNHNYDSGSEIPYASDDYVYKDVTIGDFVWIGSRVMILPGTKIGKGAIIQGGAVVHGEIPPYAIAGGNPAKVFKYRDKKHFDELEKNKQYKH